MRWHPPEHAEPWGEEPPPLWSDVNAWQAETITVRRLKRPIGFRPQKAKKRKGRKRDR